MAEMIYGSICLSAVPKELFKKVMCKDGEERVFLNMKIVKRKEAGQYGHTHFASCEPKEGKVEGQSYIFGDFKEWIPNPNTESPSTEDIDAAQSAGDSDLPF